MRLLEDECQSVLVFTTTSSASKLSDTSLIASLTRNIFRQILADGTTQVITENLKARLPDSSLSTVSGSDGKSTTQFQQTADSENIDPSAFVEESKRKSICQSKPDEEQHVLPKRVKKDPAIVAKSYQKFMTKTYDVQDENDYHTIFNTSVNRNGYEVAPRDARPDVTKLFSVGATDADMDVTNLISAPVQANVNATPSSSYVTRIFDESSAVMSVVDFSKSYQELGDVTQSLASMEKDEESSAGAIGDMSEMDTAMIIEDLEVTEDEVFQVPQRSALIPSIFIEQSTIEDISMSITENVSKKDGEASESMSMNLTETLTTLSQSRSAQEFQPEPHSISLIQFDRTDEILPMSGKGSPMASNDDYGAHLLDQDSRQEGTAQLVSISTNESGHGKNPMEDLTKNFDPQSQSAEMMIEPENEVSGAQSVDKTNIFAANNSGNGMSIENNMSDPSPPNSQEVSSGTQPMDKETTEFGVKSSTFQRRQTLSKIMSRFSFPRSLDNVLEIRRRQLNQATEHYYDSLRNIELSESIESISYSPHVASPMVQRSFHTSPSRLSTSNCSTPKKSPARLFGSRSQLVRNLPTTESYTSQSTSSLTKASGEPEANPEQINNEETQKSCEDCPTGINSLNSSSSSISELLDGVNFDKSYNLPSTFDEEEDDDRDLHEDSMFEIVNRIQESSFALSPDSSFHSSFVCMDDTLALKAEDLDCKLNSFQFSNNEVSPDLVSDFQGVFVPLRKFEAGKYGARFDLSSPNDLVVYFLYDLIEVHIIFGATARSFNGIPIKFIQKLLVKSALTKDERFIPNQTSSSFLIEFKESHQFFFRSTSELIVACFEDNKCQLLNKHPTSDLLSELLSEVSQWVMRGRDLLHEITSIAQFTNCYFYQKLEHIYE